MMPSHEFDHLRHLVRERLQAELLTPSSKVLAIDRFMAHAPVFVSVFEAVAAVLAEEHLAATPYANLDQDPPTIGLAVGEPEQACLFVWPHVGHPETLWLSTQLTTDPTRGASQSVPYRGLSSEALRPRVCQALARLLRLSERPAPCVRPVK